MRAADVITILVLDHVIVTADPRCYYSMFASGSLTKVGV
jgi:hypothetical protein